MSNVKIIIFEPPMCCPGGLCGPVDPTLLQFQNTLIELKKEFKDSIEIARANMIANLDVFLDNWDVYEKVSREGLGVLPIIKINGKIIFEAHYPDLETLQNYVGIMIRKEPSKDRR